MTATGTTPRQDEAEAAVGAARAGDESAFSSLVRRYRRELQLHCYRMMGSLEDSEDLVQETFLRAWDKRASFEGRATFRAWLYRIATNACLDALERKRREAAGEGAPGGSDPSQPAFEVPWLQPYPDLLLEGIAAPEEGPADRLVAYPFEFWHYGDSIGFWDGQKLVIHTNSLMERSMGRGQPQQSERMETVEVWEKVDSSTIVADVWLYDPAVYVEPWYMQRRYRQVPNVDKSLRMNYWNCAENPNNEVFKTPDGNTQYRDFTFTPADDQRKEQGR